MFHVETIKGYKLLENVYQYKYILLMKNGSPYNPYNLKPFMICSNGNLLGDFSNHIDGKYTYLKTPKPF